MWSLFNIGSALLLFGVYDVIYFYFVPDTIVHV